MVRVKRLRIDNEILSIEFISVMIIEANNPTYESFTDSALTRGN